MRLAFMDGTNKYAVIVAGGKGARMGSVIPKQFLPLHGKPMLCYPVLAFANAFPDIKIILVLPEDQLSSAEIVLRSYLGGINVTVVAGGETRYHSVQNGLKKVDGVGIVFVHDGARPLLRSSLVVSCYKNAMEHGSAIPAIPVSESIREVAADGNSAAVDRDRLRIVQTPQAFKTSIILPAFQQQYTHAFTDEATVVENYGTTICLIEGAHDNIKVTTPADMHIAEALLEAQQEYVS